MILAIVIQDGSLAGVEIRRNIPCQISGIEPIVVQAFVAAGGDGSDTIQPSYCLDPKGMEGDSQHKNVFITGAHLNGGVSGQHLSYIKQTISPDITENALVGYVPNTP